MALSNEDKKDVKHAFGKKVAGVVSRVTNDKIVPKGHYSMLPKSFNRSMLDDMKDNAKSKALGKKESLAKGMGRRATVSDRKKDSYLSADSKVYK